MSYSELTENDLDALNCDRSFISSLSKCSCHKHTQLDSKEDLKTLQQVLSGGPYSSDVIEELKAFGTVLGDILAKHLGMHWIVLTDKHGRDLAIKYKDHHIVSFPRDMLIKRIENEEEIDFVHLFEELSLKITKMIKSGEYLHD